MDNDIKDVLKKAGIRIKRNGIQEIALIEDVSNAITYYADKYIISENNIKTGDIIEFEGKNYIIISEIAGEIGSYKARMRRSNFNIKFNFEGDIKEIHAIIQFLRYKIDSSNYITLNKDTIEVVIPYDDSNLITLGQRFIKMDSAWKVVCIDKTKTGLLILTCEKDLFNEDDDIENEIADRWKYETNEPIGTGYEITIQGSDMILLYNTATYTAKVYADGVEVQEDVTWELSNENASIVEQDGQSITIKGEVEQSSVILTATLVADNNITATKEITIGGLF